MAEDTAVKAENKDSVPFFQCAEIIYPGNDKITCQVGTPPELDPPHWHIDHEIILVLQGRVDVVMDGVHHELERDGLMFINRLSVHSVEAVSDDTIVEMVHFDPSCLNLVLSAGESVSRYHFDFYAAPLDERLLDFLRTEVALVGDLFFCMEKEQRLGVSAELMRLIVTMFKYKLVSVTGARRERCDTQADKLNAYVIFDYFRNNFANPAISLERISEELNIPAGNITAILKETTGSSFNKFLSKIRTEEAKKMLAHMSPEETVLDVSENCGFTSLPTFYRIFKQYTGANPSDYMKQKREYFLQREQNHFTCLDNAVAENMLQEYVRTRKTN